MSSLRLFAAIGQYTISRGGRSISASFLRKSCEWEWRSGNNQTGSNTSATFYEACKKAGSLATFFQRKSQRLWLPRIKYFLSPDSSVITDALRTTT
ncbi:hypothetical protein JW824_07640 [bacterium]|nr:hypothetical protein [bacterium]RQV94841.1 MAG: hypothetical protein EH221_06990 [bacterium]